MANKQQTSIGGTVEVAANSTATVEHQSDGGEFLSIIEYIGSAVGMDVRFRVRQENANNINLVTPPNDGPDSVENTDAYVNVPTGNPSRFFTFVELDAGDTFEVTIENTTAAAETVTFFASSANSRDVALGN